MTLPSCSSAFFNSASTRRSVSRTISFLESIATLTSASSFSFSAIVSLLVGLGFVVRLVQLVRILVDDFVLVIGLFVIASVRLHLERRSLTGARGTRRFLRVFFEVLF